MPYDYRQQRSIIISTDVEGVVAVFILKRAVDISDFDVCVEQVLRPTMKVGDILELYNLPCPYSITPD